MSFELCTQNPEEAAMNVCVPFICLALGAAINWRGLPKPALKAFDRLMNLALWS